MTGLDLSKVCMGEEMLIHLHLTSQMGAEVAELSLTAGRPHS